MISKELEESTQLRQTNWVAFVQLVEEQLEGKAVFHKYNEKTSQIEEFPWEEKDKDEIFNVYVKGYNVYSVGVAILRNKLKATKYKNVLAFPDRKSFLGFSHRGGGLTKIGDKIFDPNYAIDINSEEIKPYLEKAKKALKENPEDYENMTMEEVVSGFVPFSKLGTEVADTSEKALESARAIAESLR